MRRRERRAQGQPPPRGIVKIAGELCRAQNDIEALRQWDRYDTNLPGHVAQVYATLTGAP